MMFKTITKTKSVEDPAKTLKAETLSVDVEKNIFPILPFTLTSKPNMTVDNLKEPWSTVQQHLPKKLKRNFKRSISMKCHPL